MGMHHIADPATPSTTVKGIRARFYPAQGNLPRSTVAYYRENNPQTSRNRFVFASDLLSHTRLQPYIHDILVTIRYRRRVYKFYAFFKRHVQLPANQTIQNLGGYGMEGDVLLVACGKKVAVRNMRSGIEERAADRAMKRLSIKIGPIRNRTRFPRSVSFD